MWEVEEGKIKDEFYNKYSPKALAVLFNTQSVIRILILSNLASVYICDEYVTSTEAPVYETFAG